MSLVSAELPPRSGASSPIGLHRVLDPVGALPQSAHRLDAGPQLWADEVRLRVERINLDAASFRQLSVVHRGDGDAIRTDVLRIIEARGKMHNPVTGSGGMLIGVVEQVGPLSPLGLHPGQRVATLVSLTLTPLVVTDGLRSWDGRSEQIPAVGHAVLFARSIAAVLPDDLQLPLAMAALDVCGAPAVTARVVRSFVARGQRPSVLVVGGAGKSGSLALAAARLAGAARTIGVVPVESEAQALEHAGVTDDVVVVDARDPVALAAGVGDPVQVTVVCVDVPGCEGGAILATAEGGTVVFFSMATSFSAAALTAEGLAADVTLVIGNGYVPGHAELALDLVRSHPGVRRLLENRISGH